MFEPRLPNCSSGEMSSSFDLNWSMNVSIES